MPVGHQKPFEQEKLDGYQGKGRRKRKSTLEALPDLPHVGSPFEDMSEAAKTKWKILAEEWRPFIKDSDRDILRCICETWAEMVSHHEQCKTLGYFCETKDGIPKEAPWSMRLNKCRDMLLKYMVQIGATPISRAKVMIADEEKTGKFSKLMGKVN